MNILVISEVFWPERFMINDLVLEWARQGHHIEVITHCPSYPYGYPFEGYSNGTYFIEKWNEIVIHRLPFIEGYKDNKFKKYANYIKFVRDSMNLATKIGHRFDRVFVSQTGPLTVAMAANKLWKEKHIPTAIWTFDIWPDTLYSYGIPCVFPFKQLAERFVRNVYNQLDYIIVSSEKFSDVLRKYTNKDIVYAPNWLTKKEINIESSLRLNPHEFNFTFIGNISHAQNLLNVIKGFEKCNVDGARINIVGDGSSKKELEEYIYSHPDLKVTLYGRYPQNEMQDILSQSDVCLISLVEGTALELTEPLKLQDYLQSGKPIYGIIGGSAKSIIKDNELGICSNPSDIEGIAEGFMKMVEFTKTQKGKVREKSICLLNTRFCREKIIQRINETIGI